MLPYACRPSKPHLCSGFGRAGKSVDRYTCMSSVIRWRSGVIGGNAEGLCEEDLKDDPR